MAIIKSYTDLQQSKKLAEILPFETVDMEYLSIKENGKLIGGVPFVKYDSEVENSAFSHIYDRIPCWSLASLLELLPKRIEIVDNFYELSVYLYGIYYWNINNGNLCFESKDKGNLVDACYEAIVFLHEQKLSL